MPSARILPWPSLGQFRWNTLLFPALCSSRMNRGSMSPPPPLDPRCSVEIPTWSSAEFKVPREHRRSCEMIGFRSVDHPNDSVEPCFLPCVSAHMDFCVPDRQCDLTDRIYVKLIFLIFPPILPRIENERWVRTELDTTKLATFNS